jgi:hypothetical protein
MKSRSIVLALGSVALFAIPAFGYPNFVRLGYQHCVSCHISPQGGGLLNAYGRSIDEGESLRGGEYTPSGLWGDHITQDIRAALQERFSTSTGQPIIGKAKARAAFRNATELGKGFRVSLMIAGETSSTPRPRLAYQAQILPKHYSVMQALLSYRVKNGLEFAVGRDQLPVGINIPDLTAMVRVRNGVGFYDAPAQAKMYWWGRRYAITPYVFGRGGPEPPGQADYGFGGRAEFDLLGKGTTLVGFNGLRGTSVTVNRTLFGPFFRLGFKSWGILAEHDITNRDLFRPRPASFQQQASYGQVFWFPRSWLTTAVTTQRLTVEAPYRERQVGLSGDILARFSSNFSLQFTGGATRNQVTGVVSPQLIVLLYAKPVF